MGRPSKYSQEFRERAVRLVLEQRDMKRSRFDAASFPTKEDVGMAKKYDAATRERVSTALEIWSVSAVEE